MSSEDVAASQAASSGWSRAQRARSHSDRSARIGSLSKPTSRPEAGGSPSRRTNAS